MKTKHTPTPYSVNTRYIEYEDDGHYKSGLTIIDDGDIAAIAEFCEHQAPIEALETAKFIVRACNSHDKLVEALDLLVMDLTGGYNKMPRGERGRLCEDALIVLRAARGE